MNSLIIGVAGAFGSGCTKIATDYIANKGYIYLSLTAALREMFFTVNGRKETCRRELQEFGNSIRAQNNPDFLARIIIEKIKENQDVNYVVDSFRNAFEIEIFRNEFTNFYLFGIFSDREKRWERVKGKYLGNMAQFDSDEMKDKGDGEDKNGQHVAECFFNADVVISNNEPILNKNNADRLMDEKINKYLNLFGNPGSELPNDNESIMAMAYSNGYRSRCLKRKVGAVIVDQHGNTFSSGFNEVPMGEEPCKGQYGTCFRDFEKANLKAEFIKLGANEESTGVMLKKFKALDKCRSLHAEENAIINLAKSGGAGPIECATLYTTTYPCNLCANKIVQVGLRRIVYFEPYPVPEAWQTLSRQSVKQEPFEGVTFRSFFKLFRQCDD